MLKRFEFPTRVKFCRYRNEALFPTCKPLRLPDFYSFIHDTRKNRHISNRPMKAAFEGTRYNRTPLYSLNLHPMSFSIQYRKYDDILVCRSSDLCLTAFFSSLLIISLITCCFLFCFFPFDVRVQNGSIPRSLATLSSVYTGMPRISATSCFGGTIR